MSLRFRYLRLYAETLEGDFGRQLDLRHNFVIVRGENTAGKSTCMRAIVYALGLERMLTTSSTPPFAEAMLRRLNFKSQQEWIPVLHSRVALEIENGDGQVVTLVRSVVGAEEDTRLVKVFMGPALTEPGSYERKDLFARDPGAAQNEAGIHRFLPKFMGLDLPHVARHDAHPIPLYLECLFPFFIVDQLTGWRGIQARMPTYFRFQKVWHRSLEYLLAMSGAADALLRHELSQRADAVKRSWGDLVSRVGISATGLGFLPIGVPDQPTKWPSPAPHLAITDGDNWKTLDVAIEEATARVATLAKSPVPRSDEAAQRTADELRENEEKLAEMDKQLAVFAAEMRASRENRARIQQRLDALNEDLRKYKDERRLRDLGSTLEWELDVSQCPTCSQDLPGHLLPSPGHQVSMPLEANIKFIQGQIELFQGMRLNTVAALEADKQRSASLRRRSQALLTTIREQKRALRADGDAPSSAAIRKRLQAEDRLARLEQLNKDFKETIEQLLALVEEWTEVQQALRAAKADDLSASDRAKLATLQRSFADQLRQYGFSSLPIQEITISTETYRPVADGYDIGYMSASDTVRAIWAYLVGLLEVAQSAKTNHLGILVLDEPQQQHVSDMSFDALVKRAALAAKRGQQVIFATSEKASRIEEMLRDVPHHMVELGVRALVPIETTD